MTSRDHDRTSRISGPAIGKGHGKTPKNRRSGERGNVFFTLFGAVAIVGVLGAGIMATMRGPLSTMVEVNRIEQAKAEMKVSGRFIIGESEGNTTCTGDTDISTGTMVEYVEPIDPQACGTAPTGGGCIPMSSGATKTDPWGMRYGYCAWNHGPDSTSCAGTHLQGTESTNFPTVAIISAGPDRVFQSTCGNDPAYATKLGDDIVVSFTYNDAVTTSGGLWTPVGTTGASIDRDLAVTGGASFTETVDLSGTATAQLRLGAASMVLPDENELTDVMCTGNAANDGLLRVNSATMNVEICDNPSGFKSSGSVWTKTGNDISYSAGKVTAGAALDVTGATTLTGTMDVTGATTLTGTLTVSGTNATTLGGTLGVTGDTTLSGALGVTGATTLSSTLDVTGDVDVNSQLTITAANGDLDTNGVINTDLEYRVDATKMLSNDNVTSNILLGDVESPTPGTTADYLNIGDVLHGDLQNKRVAIGFADTYDVSTLTDTLTVNGTISATGLKLSPNTAGNILVNDGSAFFSVPMSNDASIATDGALTIANNAIDNDKMDDNAIGTAELQDDSVTADKISDTGGTNDQCLRISGGNVIWDDCGTGSGPGGTNTIAEVLAAGNDADGEDLVDLGDLEVNGSIVINGGGTASSVFTVTSTTNGVLLPRMTTAQRTAIAGPAPGLIVYDTDLNMLYHYNSGTTAWEPVGGVLADSLDWDDFIDTMTLDATTTINMDTNNADFNFDVNTFFIDSSANSIGIGTATPAATAALDISSTTRGFLAPRMTTAQRNAIASPAEGLMVYATDGGVSGVYQFYDGSAWVDVGGGGADAGIWSENGTNDYIEYEDTLGGVRIGRVSGQPAPATDWTLDAPNGVTYTTVNKVGVGSASVNASAIMQIESTTQGFLTPRMTIAQRNAIAGPAEGLLVYVTDAGTSGIFQFYDGTGWIDVGAGGAASISPDSIDWDDMMDAMTLDATTTIAMDGANADLNFDTNTFVIDSSANSVGIGTATPSYKFHVNQAQNASTMSGVQNMDTGASAQAGLVAESDAGQLMALQRSIAGGGLGLVGNTSSAGFSIFSQHATAGGLAFSTGPALALRMGVDSAGRVGIGISGGLNTIAPTAILDIQSTTQGALLPRMTTAQRTAIATPAEGLIVYDTDLDGLYYYNAATPAWTAVTAAGVGANSIDWDDMIDAMTLDATTTIAMGSYDLNFDANTLVIDSSANAVGIGTNTPVTALDVNGGVRVGSMAGNAPTYMALNSLSDVNSAPTDGQCLVYNNTASEWQAGACGGAGSIAADALDWDKLVDAMTLDATTTINMDTNNADFNFDTNTFFIDSSANSVGVGTATPKLYPSAATGLTVSSAGTPATTSVVEIQGNQTTDANVGGVLFYNSTNLNAAIISNRSGADNSGNMLFYTSTTGTLTERMRIHSTGRISIGPTIADATAVLDVQSTTQGFLTPRMTTAQRTAIATPANGLMVFDTDLRAFYYYDLTGTAWRAIGTGSNAAKIIDADGDTQIQVEEGADDDTIRFDTAGTERAVISSNGNMGIGTATPGAKLDVVGDVGVSNYLKFGGVTGNAPVYIGPALDALSDVEVPTPTNGQCLIYNSGTSTWVNGACGGTVGDDTLDWDKFTDTMTLDATTTINMDTNNADLNFDANTFFIDSSASSIGIGTTTPVMNLDIMGGASAGLGVAVPGTASGQAALTLFTMRSDLTKWLGQDNTNKGWHMGAYSNAYTTAALQNALTIVNWNGTTYGSGVVFFPSGAVQLNNGVETPSAMMDINSTTRGFLAPRMSTAQRTAIASPANGLMVFDTDLRAFYYYDLTIAAWRAIGGESTSLSDADADTRVLVEKNADEDFVRIETAGTERVTVNNGGNVGIGTTTPANRLHVVGDIRTSTSLVLGLTAGNAPTYISGAATSVSDADGDTKIQVEEGADDDTIRFDTANTERMTISNAGAVSIAASTGVELTVTGDINYSGVLTDTSDMRLKTDIKPLEARDVIEKLGMIDTYTFHMKDNPHGPMEYGVMAQELEKIFPELVSTADDEMGTKSVNYIGLIAPMIEGVKTLKAENESLKAEIAAMKTAQGQLIRDVEGLKVHTEYGISRAAYDNWLVLVMMAMMGGMFFMLLRRQP